MCNPSLQHLLVQAHVQELQRSRQTSSTRPITTTDHAATRQRNAAKLSAVLGRAIERFAGQPDPEAHAF